MRPRTNFIIIKNIIIRSTHGTSVGHIQIGQQGKWTIVNDIDLKRNIAVPTYDAKQILTIMPGMLDSHVHGQGGMDFADVKQPEDVLVAAMALGQTGLSYALATLPSLDPNWCELCLLDDLPNIGTVPLFKQLPGSAKSTYLIVDNKLFYVDKIAETIQDIEVSPAIVATLKAKFNITDKNSSISRLSLTQLKEIATLTNHQHVVRGLPVVLQAIETHMQNEKKSPTPGATKILGVHLEGPFIAQNCKGAHDERVLQASVDYDSFLSILNYAPSIKEWKMTLAPDLPGAVQFMHDLLKHQDELHAAGLSIKINAGHTNASPTFMDEFMSLGAAGVTHCGNACKETQCRKTVQDQAPTSHVVNWVLKNKEKCPKGIELIVDGHHLSQSFVKLVTQTIGTEKINLVTDALGPTGLADGRYMLGTLPIYKKGDVFYLADPMQTGEAYTNNPPTLAGGAAPLHACAQRFVAWTAAEKNSTFDERMEKIYLSAIQNPKTSSLSENAISNLDEQSNAVIFDEHGKLILSLVNHAIIFLNESALIPLKEIEKTLSIPGYSLHAGGEKNVCASEENGINQCKIDPMH